MKNRLSLSKEVFRLFEGTACRRLPFQKPFSPNQGDQLAFGGCALHLHCRTGLCFRLQCAPRNFNAWRLGHCAAFCGLRFRMVGPSWHSQRRSTCQSCRPHPLIGWRWQRFCHFFCCLQPRMQCLFLLFFNGLQGGWVL